ncbi:uncharacterized protein AC631_02757 [Debaryomyces fabryi]|uniref:Pre-mRNA-splicing factor 38 n=1 Tax=Debaryomyces fabryi TaxID=58627 RepID=A0A0V1PYY7_9ASCO|nr:uncharacterized protein AC631_02757 [Debaryomyces fabryi]KSA01463.1 hypothetical protein AC631_02757 [Debaryomyces fabryi]CUM57408.1 unnamed protein product [Debaryomyces fabryi]
MENSKKQAAYNDKSNVIRKAYLVEPIIRHRIQDSLFYKQYLYLTNEATILPIITSQVKYIGSTNANGKPTPFICCFLRLLELEPSREIIEMCLHQLGTNEFKYLTALIMLYIRVVWTNEDVFNTLDPFYSDYRKLRFQLKSPIMANGMPILYRLSYVDEWCDDLLNKERVIDLILPRMVPRRILQERGLLGERNYHGVVSENEDESENESDDYESDSD